jgi:hypothetical protein
MLATFTLNAMADSFIVTATVEAPNLTQPAVITDPQDGDQVTAEALTVSGTCPAGSYVNLTDNSVFAGTDTCTANAFQISLDLSSGTNQLQAQDYNVTNVPGPSSSAITVTYTPPSPPPSGGGTSSTPPSTIPTTPITAPAVTSPVATPATLQVTQVDLSIPYISQSLTPVVSYQPTFTGIAPPYSYVVIVVHSDFYTCTTYADAQGYWTCTMPSNLPSTIHTVQVTAKTPAGSSLTFPQFTIKVITAGPAALPPPAPFHITSSYTYNVHSVGQAVTYNIGVSGGRAPYAYTVVWGDGKTSTIIRQTGDSFAITHTYGWVDASLASKIIKIQAIDAAGQSSTLQLVALVRNPAFHSVVANVTKSSGLWGLFTTARPWLWLLWPGYVIIILLVFSFWLGEREELSVLLGKRRPFKHHHGLHH